MNSETSLTDEELLAIAKVATPGPWKAEGTVYEYMIAELRCVLPGDERGIAQFWQHANGYRDAVFSATFNPAFVTSLIERAQASEARARTAEEALKNLDEKFSNVLFNLSQPNDGLDWHAVNRVFEGFRRQVAGALSPTRTEGDQ